MEQPGCIDGAAQSGAVEYLSIIEYLGAKLG
jgi:hypothetical protein